MAISGVVVGRGKCVLIHVLDNQHVLGCDLDGRVCAAPAKQSTILEGALLHLDVAREEAPTWGCTVVPLPMAD